MTQKKRESIVKHTDAAGLIEHLTSELEPHHAYCHICELCTDHWPEHDRIKHRYLRDPWWLTVARWLVR